MARASLYAGMQQHVCRQFGSMGKQLMQKCTFHLTGHVSTE